MAHLSPVRQISVFKKASGRSRRMVVAELMKKSEPLPSTRKETPLKSDHSELVPPAKKLVSPAKKKTTLTGDHPELVPPAKKKTPLKSDHSELVTPAKKLVSSKSRRIPAKDDHSELVEACRVVDNSETCADDHLPTPDIAPMVDCADHLPTPEIAPMEDCAASSQATGFENLLRRVGSPDPVCPNVAWSSVTSSSVSPGSRRNDDSGAVTLIPKVQTRPASPQYLPAPRNFCGLWNLGNTCYMNTVIQLLYHLKCFRSDMICRAELPVLVDCVFRAVLCVFDRMAHYTERVSPEHLEYAAEKCVRVSPEHLQYAAEKYMIDFDGGVQQDAQEFLLNILDKIEGDIDAGLQVACNADQRPPNNREDICPTTRNFSCLVRNILSCEQCDNILNVEQSCRHFSIPLPEDRRDPQAEVPDIEALLNIYFQSETLAKTCEKCGAETMQSVTKIVQLPRVLILHINRFEMDSQMLCSKVSVPVKFADSLNLGNWCTDKVRGPCHTGDCLSNDNTFGNGYLPALEDCRENFGSNGHALAVSQEGPNMMNGNMQSSQENGFAAVSSTSYTLHGVVSHVGTLASSGHYMVDIYDVKSSKYVRCDDILVREVSPEDVFCKEKFTEAYVLLYVLRHDGAQH